MEQEERKGVAILVLENIAGQEREDALEQSRNYSAKR